MFPKICKSSQGRTKGCANVAHASQIGSINAAKIPCEPVETSSRNTESDIPESEKKSAGSQTRTTDPAEETFSGPQEKVDVALFTDVVVLFVLEPQRAIRAQTSENPGVT